MAYNINAADAYARQRGSKLERLSEEQLALFETNHDGTFKFDNAETRAWMSIHPKHGERSLRFCRSAILNVGKPRSRSKVLS